MSADNDIMAALKAQLISYFSGISWTGGAVAVERNIAAPAVIAAAGCVILRDGSFDEEHVLGGTAVFYTQHAEIELYVEDGTDTGRDTAYAALAVGVGAAIEGDKTFNGKAQGCLYSRPSPRIVPVDGGADIKCAVIHIDIDFETATPLA
jgi:hypothetical protein